MPHRIPPGGEAHEGGPSRVGATLAYTSIAECIRLDQAAAANGYQNVSIQVKSVTYLTWTFPRCSSANFGPKTYRHTAAVNYVLQQSAPSGGVTALHGIEHFVQTKDGLWRFFSVTANCT